MSEGWDRFYERRLTVEQHLENLWAHAPLFGAVLASDPRTVLEVGIGTGTMSRFLASVGLDVTAVDNDAAVVERARKEARKVTMEIRVADAFRLAEDFEPGAFDVAYSQGFFEHFADDAIVELVRAQLAVAETVVFSVPSARYPTRDFGDERLLTAEQWRQTLADFSGLEVRYYCSGLHVLVRVRGDS